MAAGGEQGVVQFAAHAGDTKRGWQRAAAAPEMDSQRRRGSRRARRRAACGDRSLHGIENRDHLGEAADRENLFNDTVESGDGDPALFWFRFRRRHQRAQSGAGDIRDLGKIDDDIGGAGARRDQQPILKRRSRQVVDAPDRPQHKKTVATPFTDFHAPPPTGR